MSLDNVIESIDFNDEGLVPAIAQDYETGEVRMLAYMNKLSFRKTVETGYAHYWSRSREELWKKGETSGHLQEVQEIKTDCDQDAVLLMIQQVGVACHTGERNCFFNYLSGDEWSKESALPDNSIGAVLGEIQRIVRRRDENRPDDSYTVELLEEGTKTARNKLLEKLGEEFTESVLAAKDEDGEELLEELSDFLYHLLVLLRSEDLSLDKLASTLAKRLPE